MMNAEPAAFVVLKEKEGEKTLRVATRSDTVSVVRCDDYDWSSKANVR